MNARGEARAPGAGDAVVPRATVGRLSLYLRQLERFLQAGNQTISSRRLGHALGVSDAQVRKDLAYFGQFGHAGIGYRVDELMQAVRRILGTDHDWAVALIGFGNLGRALVGYRGFRRHGFDIVAIFDMDPSKVGQAVDGANVQHVDRLRDEIAARKIALAIVAVPAESAQEVTNRLVAAGIRGILNFAPAPLQVPKHVSVVSVDLAIQLEMLTYQVENAQPGGTGDRPARSARALPGGVIGNTRDFGSLIPGSSPGRVTRYLEK
jgi:redox-sensing transcriptional repressor